jgi:type IX secretion system PorP/SprF family membrane protein
MKKLYFLTIIFLFKLYCTNNIIAQENSIYENYYLSPFILNPAMTGSEYYPVADISARKQWIGFTDAPSTYSIAANYRIGSYDFYDPKGFINKGPLKLKDRVGVGVALFRDNNGPLSNTGALMSYAYHFPVSAENKLSLGLSFIWSFHSLNTSVLKPNQKTDPFLLNGNNSVSRPNVNFGTLFYNTTYFIGISANKIFPDVTNENLTIQSSPSIFLYGGYKLLKDNFKLNYEPSVALKKFGSSYSADLNLKMYVKRLNWIAISYSTVGKLNFRFGLRLYKMLYAGYNFEQTLSNVAQYNYGSHEIHLGINLGLTAVEGIKETVNNLDN